MGSIQDFMERSFEVGDFKISLYNFAVALVILLAGWLVNRLIRRQVLARIWSNRDLSSSVRFTVNITIRYLIAAVTIVLAINALGINVGLLFAGLAALLFGLGIGIQGLFNDLISGFILLFDDSMNVGDTVEVDGMIGEVQEISLRTTRIKTNERIVFIVPNSRLTSNRLVNFSTQSPISYYTLTVGVAYGSDVELVRDLLLQAASETANVLQWPEPKVRFDDFGNSSLDFVLFFASKRNLEILFVKSDLRFTIDAKFREHDVRIPFPQRDLHLRSDLVGLTPPRPEPGSAE